MLRLQNCQYPAALSRINAKGGTVVDVSNKLQSDKPSSPDFVNQGLARGPSSLGRQALARLARLSLFKTHSIVFVDFLQLPRDVQDRRSES